MILKKKKYKIELSHHQVCALSAILEWSAEDIESPKIDPDLRKHFLAIQRVVKKTHKQLDFS
jgi:hypothetical protein